MSMLKFASRLANINHELLLMKLPSISIAPLRNCNTNSETQDEASGPTVDPAKDRRTIIPVETSIRYLSSNAYKETYGENPVWKLYRRNHKGAFAPRKTRKSCIKSGIIKTGNPCPICRDEYLILHETNVSLLKQFISEHTGQILETNKTNVCRRKHKELLVAIERARDQGLITFDVPIREYDYSEYMPSSVAQ